jgi:hypothetical protein
MPALVSDAVFLLLHDKNSGRAHLAPQITGLSLGAAVLGELYLAGLIGVQPRRGQEGVVMLPDRYPTMPDVVQHLALEEIGSEVQPPSVWMRLLGPLLVEPVAERLERTGWIEPLRTLRMELPGGLVLSRAKRWRPCSPLSAETTALHLDGLLRRDLAFRDDELLIAALTYACGLHRQVFPYASRAHAERVAQEAGGLPPPLVDLIRDLHTTVNRLVSTSRH